MRIFGIVKDGVRKEPIPGAKVTFYIGDKELAVRSSDAGGKFEYRDVDQYIGEDLTCRVEKEGYLPFEKTREIEGEKVTLEVELVEETLQLRLALRNKEGDSVEGVRIFLEVEGQEVGAGLSGKDGVFETELDHNLKDKSLNYRTEMTDFETASGSVRIENETSHDIVMKRLPVTKIVGTVIDKTTERPLPGAKIALYIGDKELAVRRSNSEGQFEYEEKGAPYLGKHLRCTAEKGGYEHYKGTYKIEHEKVAMEIKLLEESVELDLVVKDETGNPLKNVSISLELKGEKVGFGVSDKNGRFKISLSPNFKDKSLSYKAELANFEVASGEVRVLKGVSHDITMRSFPVIKISGQVKDGKGEPVSGAKVSLTVGDEELAKLYSDANGRFEHEEKDAGNVGEDLTYRVEKDSYKISEGTHKIQEGGLSVEVKLNPQAPPPGPPTLPEKEPGSSPSIPIVPIVAAVGLILVAVGAYYIISSPSEIEMEFNAYPLTVNVGGESNLTWKVSNADEVFISSGVGDLVGNFGPEGNIVISPTETTVYTLTTGDDDKDITKSVTVNVLRSPVINFFRSNPEVIGRHESSTLSWNVSNVESVSIRGMSRCFDPVDNCKVSPKEITTYTLIASNDVEEKTKRVTVDVKDPTIISFTANPDTVGKNGRSSLRWDVDYAEVVSIDHGEGEVPESGVKVVQPTENTIYTLTASSQGKKEEHRVTVRVKPIIDYFRAEPPEINSGGSSELSWMVYNAKSTSISPEFASDSSGIRFRESPPERISGYQSVSPGQTTTYTLTALNGGESAEDEVTVNVILQ